VNLGDKYGRGTRSTMDYSTDKRTSGDIQCVPTGFPKSLIGTHWRYALACIDELGLTLRAELIWQKPNAMPESVRDRVQRSHETWFHFTKSTSYYANAEAIREPRSKGDGTKLASSVWSIPTRSAPKRPPHLGHVRHSATFPAEWPLRLISGWCPPGGIVLDPMGGSGTVARAARHLGRLGLSVDNASDYCLLADWHSRAVTVEG